METFREIVHRYSPQVYRHALSLLRTHEDAEEAVQDVFLRIHRALPQFRGDARITTWIWRITVNVCLTRLEKKRLPIQSLDDDPPEIAADDTPLTELLRTDTREVLESAMTRIPPAQASALLMFYGEGMNYREIADVLGVPDGTVATLLFRGRERLRRILRNGKEEEK